MTMKKTLMFFIFIICLADSAQAQIDFAGNDTTKVRITVSPDLTSRGVLYVLKSEDQYQEVIVFKNQDILKHIEASDIQSIDVFKGESATNKFGSKAENGAVVLHFKKDKFKRLQIDLNGILLEGK